MLICSWVWNVYAGFSHSCLFLLDLFLSLSLSRSLSLSLLSSLFSLSLSSPSSLFILVWAQTCASSLFVASCMELASEEELGPTWHFGGWRRWDWLHDGQHVNGYIEFGSGGSLTTNFPNRGWNGWIHGEEGTLVLTFNRIHHNIRALPMEEWPNAATPTFEVQHRELLEGGAGRRGVTLGRLSFNESFWSPSSGVVPVSSGSVPASSSSASSALPIGAGERSTGTSLQPQGGSAASRSSASSALPIGAGERSTGTGLRPQGGCPASSSSASSGLPIGAQESSYGTGWRPEGGWCSILDD